MITVKLTERDKHLIYITLFFLSAISLWYFIIKPMTAMNAEMRALTASANIKCEELSAKAGAVPEVKAAYTLADKEYKEAVSYFYPYMSTSDIDSLITGIALKHGLRIQSFSVTSAVFITLTPYIFSDPALNWEVEEPNCNSIYTSNISLTVCGSVSALNSFIDSICEFDSLRLCSFNWSQINKAGESGGKNNYYYLDLKLELYMCDK